MNTLSMHEIDMSEINIQDRNIQMPLECRDNNNIKQNNNQKHKFKAITHYANYCWTWNFLTI